MDIAEITKHIKQFKGRIITAEVKINDSEKPVIYTGTLKEVHPTFLELSMADASENPYGMHASKQQVLLAGVNQGLANINVGGRVVFRNDRVLSAYDHRAPVNLNPEDRQAVMASLSVYCRN